MVKLGLKRCARRIVAAGLLCASCSEPDERPEQGRTEEPAEDPAASPSSELAPMHAPAATQNTPADLEAAAPLDRGSSEQVEGGTSSAPTSGVIAPPMAADTPAAPSDDELKCYPLLAHDGDEKTPYAVGAATDAYVAFTFAAPWEETAYAVALQPVIDNKKVVHHWLLYQDNSAGTPGATVEELLVPGAHPDAQLIAAWTPGTDPLDFRQMGVDVGLELPSDTTYTLEFHYNSTDADATDRSGFEVCTSPRKPAHTAGYSWLGQENWLIPSATWTGTCQPEASEPIHILGIVPHMHYKGRHMKVTVRRADGSEELIHDRDFDFAYERMYPLDLTLERGDAVTTTCTYSEPSTYGPAVTDEMCYLFTVAYPRGALVSPDLVGGLLHGGTSCFGE